MFLVFLFSSVWQRSGEKVKEWQVDQNSEDFTTQYDEIQGHLEFLAGRDDMLSGLLSRSKGQILRVAVTLHALFHVGKDETLVSKITDSAIKAAINFVEVSCHHSLFLIGRKGISEERELFEQGLSQ